MKYQPSAERYDKMQYKYCGNSGLLLPRISLGLWHNFGSVDDFGVATDMIKYAFDNGVTHFDLCLGKSQAAVWQDTDQDDNLG